MAKKIILGSREMWQAFLAGDENYQPGYPGLAGLAGLGLEEEAGVTTVSKKNLLALADEYGVPHMILVGPNCGMLFIWKQGYTYLATGFGLGYGGEGPTGLARVIATFKKMNIDPQAVLYPARQFMVIHASTGEEQMEAARKMVLGSDEDFQGILTFF